MKQRAQSLVVVLLSLATLIGFTSAISADGVAGLRTGGVDLGPAPAQSDDGPVSDTSTSEGAIPSTGGPEGETAPGALPATTIAGRSATAPSAGGSAGARQLPPLKVAYLILDLTGVTGVVAKDPTAGHGNDEAFRESQEFRALIDEANAAGGVGGRQIEAREYRFGLTDLDESHLVQSCVTITEDYGAAYVLDTFIMSNPVAQQCFAQHHVVVVTHADAVTEDFLGQLRPYIATTDTTVDREFEALTPKLQEVGYFQGAKVGVFLDDRPQAADPYARILKPALERAGAPPLAEATAGESDNAAQANAVLKFRSANVDHVIFIGGLNHFRGFSNTAESQGYRPRYAFTDYLTGLGGITYNGAPAQLDQAVGVSTCDHYICVTENASRSSSDVTTPYDRTQLSPGFRRCLDSLSRARKTDYYKPGEAGASANFFHICEHVLLWLDVMKASGSDLSPARFAASLRAFGTSYQSPTVHATDFTDGRQAGATEVAAGVYDMRCACFVRRTSWTRAG